MKGLKKLALFLARIFMSLVFILSAANKFFNWQKAETSMNNVFYDWQNHVSFSITLQQGFANLVAWSQEILILATIVELIGGMLIFLGWKPKLGAFLLLLFFLPTTFLLHSFWFLDGAKQDAQMAMFLKNLAICSGLFLIMVFGVKLNEPPPPKPKPE
jgi:putative oxidoreductase